MARDTSSLTQQIATLLCGNLHGGAELGGRVRRRGGVTGHSISAHTPRGIGPRRNLHFPRMQCAAPMWELWAPNRGWVLGSGLQLDYSMIYATRIGRMPTPLTTSALSKVLLLVRRCRYPPYVTPTMAKDMFDLWRVVIRWELVPSPNPQNRAGQNLRVFWPCRCYRRRWRH